VRLLGIHQPGSSPLHRLGPGTKLAGLAVVGLVLLLLPRWQLALGLLLGVLAAGALARVRWPGLAPLLVLLAALGAFQLWQRGWEQAVQVCAALLALVLAGSLVTATTPADRLLDLLVRAARPLRRLGLREETVALAVALVLRTVPALGEVLAESRDAARARGLERSPRAFLVPTAVRTVARAHTVGEALAARGLGE